MISDLITFKQFFKNLITANPSWGIKTVEFFDWFRVVNDQKSLETMTYPALFIREPDEVYDLETETTKWDFNLMVVAHTGNVTFDEIDILKNDCRNKLKIIIKNLQFAQLPDIIIAQNPTISYQSNLTGDKLVGADADLKITTPKFC